jgi:hypothetical protein
MEENSGTAPKTPPGADYQYVLNYPSLMGNGR